jgi:hypothetical protein
MKNKAKDHNQSTLQPPVDEIIISPGYPSYPADEDIYKIEAEDENIDPEDIFQVKTVNDDNGHRKNDIFSHTAEGDDLDVPGSELDDEQEEIGSEDEENNYYSIGGDDHEDLEENHTD